jgi:hypothetical protein
MTKSSRRSQRGQSRRATGARRVQQDLTTEKVVLGGILCQGLQVITAAGIDLRAEDFSNPDYGHAYRWLRDNPDRWAHGYGNLIDIHNQLDKAGLAAGLGQGSSGVTELMSVGSEIGPEILKHRAHELIQASIERQRREAAVEFANGRIGGDDFTHISQALDDRMAAFNAGHRFQAPEARPLLDYLKKAPDPQDTLLGNRFLCRRGGMVFVGPSGIGKSSASVQMDILWSIGRAAFGINVPRPLRILQIQAENDEGDIHEMVRGAVGPLGLTDVELETCRQNLHTVTEKARTAERFIKEVLIPALHHYRPDIVRIDPLLAYLGADPTDTAKLSEFCRNLLNPVLDTYACGCALNHHTPKTTNRDTSNWRASDWMYSGAGGAELTNWARAILVVEPTSNPAAFRFIAAKRGRRIGWCDEMGEAIFQRVFCHSEGSISWREATLEEATGIRTRGDSKTPTDEELIAHVPITGTIPKDVLLAKWNDLHVGVHKCAAKLKLFLSDDPPRLFEHRKKRSGTRPQVLISRQEQTLL